MVAFLFMECAKPGCNRVLRTNTEYCSLHKKRIRKSETRIKYKDIGFFVYEMYDEQDNLLYVGRTRNPSNRISGHKCTKEWWTAVHRIRWSQFDTEHSMRVAEHIIIREKQPRYNRPTRPS